MGIDRRTAVAAGAEPAVVGGRVAVLLRQQVVHQSPPDADGDARDRDAAPGAGAGQPDGQLRRAARRAASHRGRQRRAKYFVVVPASPIETGAAATHGPLRCLPEATQEAAPSRGSTTRLATLRSENLDADGELGDYRPLRALADAVDAFHPDQIVIATLPPEYLGVASLRRRGPRPRRVQGAGDARGRDTGRWRADGFRNDDHRRIQRERSGPAPLHLAAQLSRCTGDKIIAAAIVERPWPPKVDPVEDEYLTYVERASQGVARADGRPASR